MLDQSDEKYFGKIFILSCQIDDKSLQQTGAKLTRIEIVGALP